MPRTLLVVAGGDRPSPTLKSALPIPDLVIGADSGVDSALALGYGVDVAVGDFDSVSAAGLATAERSGALVERYSSQKDETDLELAMAKALTYVPDLVIVIGLEGGRVDHYLANLLLLTSPRYKSVHIDSYIGRAKATVVWGERTLSGRVGELVSLLPLGGDARLVSCSGMEYKLSNERLVAHSPRGVSNTFATPLAKVSVEHGVVLAIQPERLASDAAS